MSRQVYFVIGVDLDDKTVFIDDDTFTARFGKDEQVWDTDKQEWREYEGEEQEEYDLALEILNTEKLRDD
jgi:hypothetical protein